MKQITFCRDQGEMTGRFMSCLKCPFNKKCCHFKTLDIFPSMAKSKTPKRKLQVESVWSSDDDEMEVVDLEEACSSSAPGPSTAGVPKTYDNEDYTIKVNDYLLVQIISESSNARAHQFVGICQQNMNSEVKVMFLKQVNKANKMLFMVDENDVSFIATSQVVAVLPPPELVMKGNRMYYKFKNPVQVV